MNINENYFKMDNPMNSNSIEDILEENEHILVRLKPNKTVLILEAFLKGLPLTLLWLAFDLTFIIIMIVNNVFAQEPAILWFIIPFFALHLTPVWMYIGNIIKTLSEIKNIDYAFTEKRIIIRSGVIGIDFKNLYYTDIEGINCKVGLLDKLFKVGDLYIKAHDQSSVLMNISNPYFYLTKLQKITLDIKSDIQYPNDLRPKENHGYNTEYKG